MRPGFLVFLMASLVAAGCSFDESGIGFADTGVVDLADARTIDATAGQDASRVDARVIDAPLGTADATIDGMLAIDAPLPDAPVPDAALPDAALPDAFIPDAAPADAAPVLVDTGLIVRYFINEAASGQTPTQLVDSAPNPLNLGLTYTDELSFTESGGNRGLQWTAAGGDARAEVAVNGTKIRNSLNGSQTGTIEVVIDIDDVTGFSSRISHIGSGMQSGEFSLTSTSTGSLTVRVKGFDVGTFPVNLPASGRIVVHAVLDTTLATAGNRTRLYVDGAEIANTGGFDPLHNDTIAIGMSSSYVLGNRAIGDRSFQGTLHYGALYSAALTPAEIANNAAVLSASDD